MTFRPTTRLLLFFILLAFVACRETSNTKILVTEKNDYAFTAVIDPDTTGSSFVGLINREAAIKKALGQQWPVILLDSVAGDHALAQVIAMSDERFRSYFFDKTSAKPYLSEIFQVYAARPQDVPAGANATGLYRVEMYNYALNLTTIAMIDVPGQQALSVDHFPQTQPDLNPKLEKLAIEIATHSPDVISALGYKPGQSEALMAATKTALNRTRCERSLHLCVAPTFIKGDKALWAIVDLTENKVVGIRWTNVGTTGPGERISERKLLFEKIMECNCREEVALDKSGWKMKYVLTTSDGLRISGVSFNGKAVIESAKLVDWHVSYSGTDGFGYSDAVGCPEFSQAAVLAVSQPKVSDLIENGTTVGFVLEQSFQSEQWPRPCNYNYVQRYEFYNNGRFRIATGSLGRGCGNDGTYRPVMRIVFAGEKNNFFEWGNSNWNNWRTEQWKLQDDRTAYTGEGYQYMLHNTPAGNFYVMPGRGQFDDGGRGDNAFVYVTKYHVDKNEGESDLVTLGPCCNTDYRQGPEKFIEPQAEDIRDSRLVLWYVPQLKNDDTPGREYCWAESYVENGRLKTKAFPCMSGPMFIPAGK